MGRGLQKDSHDAISLLTYCSVKTPLLKIFLNIPLEILIKLSDNPLVLDVWGQNGYQIMSRGVFGSHLAPVSIGMPWQADF